MRTSRTRRLLRSRGGALLALLAAAALAAGLAVGLSSGGPKRLVPGGGNTDGSYDPLAYNPARVSAYAATAAAGLSHVLYEKSPGGIVASARRTARYRATIDAAARGGPVDADTLEAIVLLESAGRADVVASTDPASAAGLTQILADTATKLLGMRVDVQASGRLAAQITTALLHGRVALADKLRARRARVDQRFDPRAELAATERYLAIAQRIFGRADLAVVSYHMGIGNLENVLRRYAGGADAGAPIARLVSDQGLSYAQLFFDSTPLHHAAASALLSQFGDDSQTYLWRVEAAKQIMRLYRDDPAQLARLARLQAGLSAEHVLRGPDTAAFVDPAALAAARASGALLAVPTGAAGLRFGLAPIGPLHLRPDALATALYIGAGVRAIGASATPLQLSAATTDASDLRAAAAASHGLADADPLHATGYAFDIVRNYATPAQAQAFQFMLDRLLALNIIAWERHKRIIHIVVGPGANALHGVLAAAGVGGAQ